MGQADGIPEGREVAPAVGTRSEQQMASMIAFELGLENALENAWEML